jgi:L-ascorbate metabolism protein UlaG (beta-lactamase superfamily)
MTLTRRTLLKSGAAAAFGFVTPVGRLQQSAAPAADRLSIQLIRHATCIIRYGGKTILLDPMFSDAGAMPAIARTPNPRPNPLVAMPVPAATLMAGLDAVLVTHTHFDHWDGPARDALPKRATLFAQPPDRAKYADAGYTDVRAVESPVSWEGITIARTAGQHGRGDNVQRMGPVSGFVLSRSGSPTVYVAGDTVWCPDVAEAIRVYNPNVIVVNAGAAQFLEGGPITMDVDDVVNVCRAAPQATVVAVHMEAINHCVLTRDALRAGLTQSAVRSTVLIPRDGEDLRI